MTSKYNNTPAKLLAVFITICFLSSLISCKKYLDAKPDKSLVIPSTLNDLQAILDYTSRMNEGPSYGEASADNYYLDDADYNTLQDESKKAYTWENYSYSNYINDWSQTYDVIYPANVVLEGIEKIIPTPQTLNAWNNIKGSALVFRANSLMQGAFIFCNAYDENTADQDLGMVLRLNADFNAPSTRSTVRQTYDRILLDLKEAAPLLPDIPLHVLRPSKPAAYGLIARTYLAMRKYDSCAKYANLCLQIKSDLLDYNSLPDINDYFAFSPFNPEVIMANVAATLVYYSVSPSISYIDSSLYNSYLPGDLRRSAFFQAGAAGYQYKGSYSGTPWELFIGIATDEVFLMRAECYARSGNKDSALADLNTLMITKWTAGQFIPFAASSPAEALDIILRERRKELIFRNLRWMDIKRLNKEGANIVLTRLVNGSTYTLPPNDNRYALPLPLDIINMTGVEQNPK